MSIQDIPGGGGHTVWQSVETDTLTVLAGQNGLVIASAYRAKAAAASVRHHEK